MPPSLHILGFRHHGPGSARSVVAALSARVRGRRHVACLLLCAGLVCAVVSCQRRGAHERSPRARQPSSTLSTSHREQSAVEHTSGSGSRERPVNDTIAKLLSAQGADPGSFRELPSGILHGQVPGAQAAGLWTALRQAFPETGLWPIIRGDVLEPDEQHDADARPILARAPTGSIRQLLAGRCAEMCAHNAELVEGLDPAKPFERLAEAVDAAGIYFFIGSEPRIPDWPGTPPVHESGFVATRDVITETTREAVVVTETTRKTVGFALIPLEHPYEAVARLGFLGGEDRPPLELIVAVLREWERQYGAVPACITNDIIELVVDRPPQTRAQAFSLAGEQWIFCEDIVQGTKTVRGLAIELWQAPRWFFWWD